MESEIKELMDVWDKVAYNEVLPAFREGNYESAEDGVADLINIDVDILRKINKAEEAMGEQ